MSNFKNPSWWSRQHDASWETVKAAFKRDWDQTKHDFGENEPDTRQNVGTTVKQAAGKQTIPPRGVPNYDEVEPAYRFGYGARKHYGDQYAEWNDKAEERLRHDWLDIYPDREAVWGSDLRNIRTGWDYDE